MTEPWIITCETCQTRLRVRSAEAIGAILACPKCQSLVHVAPPTAREGDVVPDMGAAAAAPGGVPSSHVPLKLAIVGACAVAVAVIGLVVGLRQTLRNGNAVAASRQAGDSQPATTAAGRLAVDRPMTETASAADPQRTPEGEEPETPAAESGNVARDATAAPSAPPQLPDLPRAVRAVIPQDSAPSLPQESRAIPPVGVAQLDLDLTRDRSAVTPKAPPEPLSAPQDELLPGDASAGPSPADEPAPPLASTMVRMTIQRVAANGEPLPAVDPAQALSLPMAGLVLDDASPVELVRLIADLTGAPLTITPEAYLAVQHSPTSSVSGRHLQTTAGDVLTEVLQQHGLHVEQQADHLIVTRSQTGATPASHGGDWRDLPPSERLQEKLKEHVTYSFTQPTPLADVIRHIERTSGVAVLADWPALAEIGLTPASSITSSVVDQPLCEVLDGLLPQLEMDWRMVGEAAIWLSAREIEQ